MQECKKSIPEKKTKTNKIMLKFVNTQVHTEIVEHVSVL